MTIKTDIQGWLRNNFYWEMGDLIICDEGEELVVTNIESVENFNANLLTLKNRRKGYQFDVSDYHWQDIYFVYLSPGETISLTNLRMSTFNHDMTDRFLRDTGTSRDRLSEVLDSFAQLRAEETQSTDD